MTENRPDANQLLMTGGKAPESVDWGQVPGTLISGRLLSGPTTYQPREFDKANPGQGPLRYWPDGNPMWAVYVDLDIAGIGIRRLYIEKQRLTTAIQLAMVRAGVGKLEGGGTLSVLWTGTETGQGPVPANTYAAEYAPPGAQPSGDKIIAGNGASPNLPQSAPAQWHRGGHVNPPPAYTPPPAYVPPSTYAPPAPVAVAPPTGPTPPVLTETIAAAMRNAGIPTEGYTIIPG